MKYILIVSICLLNNTLFSQSKKFTNAMKTNIESIDSSFNNAESLLKLANSFERIANAEKDQWLPYYYAALLQVNYGFRINDPNRMDEIADKAQSLINLADSIKPKNSEISTIKSMISICRLLVNPMQRYMKYGTESNKYLDEAISYDSSNPRPYLLKAQSVKNTPEQFGGGCGPAMPLITTAIEKFKNFKPESDINPNWGLEMADQLLNDCSK
ncbi:MAG: hypothetical protein JSR00_00440 [Bacteroidetes bacterium]|nr:hypothetical protein [Bacteroidota bacterium]